MKLLWRAFLIGIIFCVIFSYAALVVGHRQELYLPATQISAVSIVFCLLILIGLNPLLRLVKLRPFGRQEIVLIFIMSTVPAGLVTFGFISEALPLTGALHNPNWNTPQSGWQENVVPYVDENLFVTDQEAAIDYARGLKAQGKQAYPRFIKRPDESLVEFGHRLFGKGEQDLWGAVPWSAWQTPLVNWFLIAMVFCLLFYSMNELIFRQWYDREKLVFPIADMSATILGKNGEASSGTLPAIFRHPLFWVGFTIAFIVLLYNGVVSARWLGGLDIIDLDGKMDRYLVETPFEGLTPHFKLTIFFTCIGLAFLLPTNISFSVWFFYILMMSQQLIAVWLGYGNNGRSFSANWISDPSFMTAQGGGAMEVFGLVCLWKVRRQILAIVYRLARSQGGKDLNAEDVKRYSLPSALFFVATVGVIYFLMRGGAPLGMAVFTYFALLLMTVAMVRLVAECGLIGFQCFFGPIHLIKTFGLMRFGWLFAARGLGSVITILSVMFIDLKTFIAPTMMNARCLAERRGLPRKHFVVAVFVAIAVTLVVSGLTYVTLSYDQGVTAMSPWFANNFPKRIFGTMSNVMESAKDMTTSSEHVGWFGFGAVVCALLVYGRQFLFWLPHPIGLVMFVNPMMKAYWFSFFLAWLCKRAAVKYCDADSYQALRAGFIGLVVGEITMVAISLLLAMMGYQSMNLSLNRN